MKTRIALILTLGAGLVVTGLNLFQVKGKITRLQTNLREQTDFRTKAEARLGSTQGELVQTTALHRETSAALEASRLKNENLALQLTKQREVAEMRKTELDLLMNLYTTTSAKLATYEKVMTIEQAVRAAQQIKTMREELEIVKREKTIVARNYAKLAAKYLVNDNCGPLLLPADLTGTVVAFDPKWRFVVLDVGENQGMLEHAELLVSRGGKLVGKVVVRSVQKERAIANVLPDWELIEIMEGDKVTPAGVPES